MTILGAEGVQTADGEIEAFISSSTTALVGGVSELFRLHSAAKADAAAHAPPPDPSTFVSQVVDAYIRAAQTVLVVCHPPL
jgi:hypothetical protein